MAEESKIPSNVELLYANGINASTGDYALPPISPADFKKGIKGGYSEPEAKALKNWRKWKAERHFAIKEGLDARKLEEAGWGIVFPVNTDPAIIDALRPLMEWRKQQAGDLYREYLDNAKGAVRPMTADDKGKWLGRQGAENYGPVDPVKVPYYLALVGDPNLIDYRFQYLLDVQYAVGRICFDTVEEYAQYAQSVVEAEKQQIQRSRQLAFFGVSNNNDPATNLSAQYLIDPLSKFTAGLKLKDAQGWDVKTIVGEEATKQHLYNLLNGTDTPGLIFTASHGMDFDMSDPNQVKRQGSLLCQDWPGRAAWRGKPITEDFYFWEKDLGSDANLWGAVAFLFACYGAGTPQYDEFYKAAFKDRAKIAEKSFVARLPQRMLSHPKGGALAVIGHVERAWGYSFAVDESPSLEAFRSALQALMTGAPVGLAFEYFNERYAEFSTVLTDKIQSDDWDPVDPLEMANTWTATNDSKNYVVLGDPAVRVRVCDQPGEQPVKASPILLSTAPVKSGANGGQTPVKAPVEAEETKPVEVPVEPAAPATIPTQPVNYSLSDDLASVKNTLAQFAQNLSGFLSKAIENAATLEITTYTSPDVSSVKVAGGQISGADVRAVTLLRIDGDIQSVVPLTEDGVPDAALWSLHVELVKQAQESRSELLKAAVSAVSSLVNLGAPK